MLKKEYLVYKLTCWWQSQSVRPKPFLSDCVPLITIEFINFSSNVSWESDCSLSGPEDILSLNALPADLLFFEATA